jgi:rhodanese-related sulfurtransferase
MDRYIEFISHHYILTLALAVVTYLLIQDLFDTAFKKFKSISPLLAVTKMNDIQTTVIDVREANDFTTSHIENAINAPLSKFAEELPKLQAYKSTPVLLICETGARSTTAAKKLTQAGFEQVFVITGGIQSWETDYKLPIKSTGKKKTKPS